MIINSILAIIRWLNKLLYNIKNIFSIITTLIILYIIYKLYNSWFIDKILNFIEKIQI